tara:strand:- start:34 stop:309 length:276 start_codon:yes stop_codon:yes gene_type:complete
VVLVALLAHQALNTKAMGFVVQMMASNTFLLAVLVGALVLLAVNTKGMGSANPITTTNFSVLGGVVLLVHQVLSTREMGFVEVTNQISKRH